MDQKLKPTIERYLVASIFLLGGMALLKINCPLLALFPLSVAAAMAYSIAKELFS